MRGFFREYGITILSAVVLAILLAMCTPLGDTTKKAILSSIGLYQEKEETVKVTFSSGGGKFDTLSYQNSHLNDTDIYIAEDTIIITIKKGETISEEDIPKPTKDGYTLIDETKYYYDDDNNVLTSTTKISENITYTAKYKSSTTPSAFTGTGIKNGYFYVKDKRIGEFKVGTVFTWHNYKWRVLKIENNQALIISEYVLDNSFSANTYADGVAYTTTTQTCASQKVQNCYRGSNLETIMNSFYTSKLTNDSAIVSTRDVSVGVYRSEYMYSTGSFNPKVFSLSYEEIQTYLTSDQQRVAYNGANAMSYWLRSGERYEEVTCDDGKNEDGSCKTENKTVTYDNSQDCFVNPSGELGATTATTKLGVRPALWIDLSKMNEGNVILED